MASIDEEYNKYNSAIESCQTEINNSNRTLKEAKNSLDNYKNMYNNRESEYTVLKNSDEYKNASPQQKAELDRQYTDELNILSNNITNSETAYNNAKTENERIVTENKSKISALQNQRNQIEDPDAELIRRYQNHEALTEEEQQRAIQALARQESAKKTDEYVATSNTTSATSESAKAPIEDEPAEVTFAADPVTNFKVPQWGYEHFVTELDNFRKGITSLTGEPGWFYFKIFFHFDDTYGLMGSVLTNKDSKLNTAYNYLYNRGNTNSYKSDNLLARSISLKRFIHYLSFINSETPWFFDKINGLDKAGVLLNDFSKEKVIEISCLEDAIDMRLTTLFYMYQYACYDEINQKEIIPENLRKFNMSIILYHVPVRMFNTAISTQNGVNITSKSLHGNPLTDYSGRMSYKLYTFKGCEFDLESILGVTPASLDNSKPFNLGKSLIKIKYDKCFTHIMNEWEQIMIGPDGIYFDPKNNIGTNETQTSRLSAIKNAIENYGSDGSGTPKIISSIIGENFIKYAPANHKLGNIYNLNIQNLQVDTVIKRNCNIYLANLFDYNPVYFRAMVIQKNVDSSKVVRLTALTGNRYTTFAVMSSVLGNGYGYDKLPNFRNLNNILNFGKERQRYAKIWYRASTLSGLSGTSDFTSTTQLQIHAQRQLIKMYGTLYAMPNYHESLRSIADSYLHAWKHIGGAWTSMIHTVKGQVNTIKNMFSF